MPDSFEEVETLQEQTEGRTVQEMEDALAAKTQALEELSQELEEIRSAFGAEGMQQVKVVLLSFLLFFWVCCTTFYLETQKGLNETFG
ncbi:hypothetical protein GOODEAATRI_022932 [Goodea atripinnis]|uniref:Uncharacterized protein n=1 Tax=Goodea atripinnis TaxID=208336 RepID=A0ABV0NMH4_9TELE